MTAPRILFAWDFHYVLLDGNDDAVREQSNISLERAGRKERFSKEDMVLLRGKPWADYFRYKCPDVKDGEISSMVAYAESLDNLITPKHIKPMDYAVEVLEEIKRRKDVNLIISTMNPDAFDKFLRWINITHLIDEKIGISREEEQTGKFDVAEYKARKLREYLETHKFERVLMTGDMPHDMKAGKSVGAITFYFNAQKGSDSVDHYITDLREILEFAYEDYKII